MIKKILQLGSEELEKESLLVDPKSKEVKELVQDLLDTLNDDPDRSAGLSAPQIGVNKRVVICRRLDKEDRDEDDPIWEVMINPEIISESEKQSTSWEGCLSIRDGDLFGKVTRPERVTVEFIDQDGNKKKLKAKGYFSHVVQHELDHLDGVLFLKYITDPAGLYTSKQLDEMREY